MEALRSSGPSQVITVYPPTLRLRGAALQSPDNVQPSELPTLEGRVTGKKPLLFSAALTVLLKELQGSPLLSEEERVFASEWQRDFEGEFSGYIERKDKEKDEEVSLAICMLLCTVVQPAMDRTEKGGPSEGILAKFEDRLIRLLETTVPENETADNFLESYENLSEQRKLMFEQMDIINRIVQEKIDQFYNKANEHNQVLSQRFVELQGRLREINKDQLLKMGQIHNSLEDHAIKVAAFFAELSKLDHAFQRMDEKIKQLTNSTLKTLEESKGVLGRIK